MIVNRCDVCYMYAACCMTPLLYEGHWRRLSGPSKLQNLWTIDHWCECMCMTKKKVRECAREYVRVRCQSPVTSGTFVYGGYKWRVCEGRHVSLRVCSSVGVGLWVVRCGYRLWILVCGVVDSVIQPLWRLKKSQAVWPFLRVSIASNRALKSVSSREPVPLGVSGC